MKAVPFLALLLALLPAGCRTPPEAPPRNASTDAEVQDPAERDAVLAALRAMNQDALRDAFAALPRYDYTRYVRTEQFDAAHRRKALRERVTKVRRRDDGARVGTVLRADSAGAFDAGLLGRLALADRGEQAATSLPQHVLPEDPSYLAPRHRDAFTYRFLPDTVLWDAAAQVVEVRARPGVSLPVRHARFYLDRAGGAVIGVHLERVEASLMFEEASRFDLYLRPAPGGGWVPALTRFTTRMAVPLRAPRQFRSVAAYYHYAPAG